MTGRQRVRGAAVLLAVGCVLGVRTVGGVQAADPDPARFDEAIDAFRTWDEKNTAPEDAVLFVGSSSIRLWPTARRFPAQVVINRGFGGSHISDVNHFFDDVVEPHRPAVIVFYAGDNDVAGGKSAGQVLGDYREFVDRVRDLRSDTDIVYVPIKLSLARWDQRETQQAANEAVRDLSAGSPRLHYADIVPPMLGEDGRPRPELFVDDGLHMTPAGYDIWTEVVGRMLADVRLRRHALRVGVARCGFVEDPRGVTVGQHPQGVDAESRAEREVGQTEHTHDGGQDSAPLTALQQADARDEPGQRQDDDDRRDRAADQGEHRHGDQAVLGPRA